MRGSKAAFTASSATPQKRMARRQAIEYVREYPVLVNDADAVAHAEHVIRDVMGADGLPAPFRR